MLDESEIVVAVAQAVGTADVTSNLQAVDRLATQAALKGAGIVVFPEALMYDFSASAEDIAAAARQHGVWFEEGVCEIARRLKICIVVGMYKPGGGPLARNTSIVISAEGNRLGEYQKVHLFDAFSFLESEKTERLGLRENFGELVTFDHGGFRFGLLICYDLRFPELSRILADRGAEVLLISSAWVAGPLKEMHWETLLKARAIENTCFVAAAGQPSPTGTGLSMIIDPSGVCTAAVASHQGIAISTLSKARLGEIRNILPSLKHRRYRQVASA